MMRYKSPSLHMMVIYIKRALPVMVRGRRVFMMDEAILVKLTPYEALSCVLVQAL
jgi:hypothetical protein